MKDIMGEGVKFSCWKSLRTRAPTGRTDSLHIMGLGRQDQRVSMPQSLGRKKMGCEEREAE